MLSIKDRLLKYYTRKLTQKANPKRENIGFKHAKTIGILYSDNSPEKDKVVSEFVAHLGTLGKQASILYCNPSPKEEDTSIFPTVTLQDVTYWGTIKHPQVRYFINTPFDYLYHVGISAPPLLDYLIALSKAKFRIGYFSSQRSPLFEMMVVLDQEGAENEFQLLVEQMSHYTKLLEKSRHSPRNT